MDSVTVTNIADAQATRRAGQVTRIDFEPEPWSWPDLGVNVHVMEPGQPASLYHVERVQEDFLVLHGECLLIADEQERRLRRWDFAHVPAGVAHVFVGAGDGPSAVLMIGSRASQDVRFEPGERAARHGASVAEATDDGATAYAGWRRVPQERVTNPWPLEGA